MTAWPVQLPLTQGCIKNPSPGWAACPCKLRPSQGGGEGMGVGGTAARAGGPVPHRLQKPEPRSHPQGQGQRTALGQPHAQGGRTTKGGGERAQGASSWKRCTAADTVPSRGGHPPARPPSAVQATASWGQRATQPCPQLRRRGRSLGRRASGHRRGSPQPWGRPPEGQPAFLFSTSDQNDHGWERCHQGGQGHGKGLADEGHQQLAHHQRAPGP